MTRAGERIFQSIRKARRYARGEAAEGFVAHVPDEVDVRVIRARLDLSQSAFAARFGFSLDAVRTGPPAAGGRGARLAPRDRARAGSRATGTGLVTCAAIVVDASAFDGLQPGVGHCQTNPNRSAQSRNR